LKDAGGDFFCGSLRVVIAILKPGKPIAKILPEGKLIKVENR
jgi:hypothetical protein